MKHQRIRREIEERELQEAQLLLEQAEKRTKKKGKKPVLEGVRVSETLLLFIS